MSPPHAVASLVAVGAALWTMLLFQVLREVTHSLAEAVLFTAVGLSSAGSLFWLSTPETYVFGSVTILAALWVAAVTERGGGSEAWFVVASAATLAVTVTNWVAGIAATMTHWPWRRTLQITTNAFALVVVLWVAQRVLIPRADFFLGYSNEQRYLLRPEAGGPRRALAVMLAHDIVMPPLETRVKIGRGRVISIQNAALWAGGRRRETALATWFALFAIGLYECVRSAPRSSFILAVCIAGAAQLGLHMLYGTETFLYSANLVPILVIIAASGTRTRARPLVLGLAAMLLVAGGTNNVRTWLDARAFFTHPPPGTSDNRAPLAMPIAAVGPLNLLRQIPTPSRSPGPIAVSAPRR